MSRSRVLWAVVASAIVGIPLIWTLASPGAVDRAETTIPPILDFSDNPLPIEPISIPFTRVSPWGDQRVHEMSLFAPVPIDVMRHVEIRIRFYQSDKRSRHPATGRLEVVGTPCTYELQPGAEINDGREQTLIRVGRCLPGDGRPTGELALTVKMGGPGTLGLYTRAIPDYHRTGGLIYVGEREEHAPEPPPAVMGTYVDTLPDFGWRRAHLLSYVWTGSVDPTPIWMTTGVLILLIFAGVLAFPLEERAGDGTNRARLARAGAAAVFCIATSLALLYAVAVPPFQAADENYYVSSYTTLVGGAMFDDAANWARRTHFDRIRANSLERFRPRDIGHVRSEIGGWGPAALAERSSLTAALWTRLARHLPAMSAPRTFVTVRLISALIFGLSVAASAALLLWCCPVRYPQLLCFPFLFVPSLPFFGMQFSETALLTSASILFASAVAVLFIDGPEAHYAGLPLGLGAAGVLLATRSGLPLAAMFATVLAARVLLGSREPTQRAQAAVFWGGIALGTSVFFMVVTAPHLDRIAAMVALASDRLPLLARPAVRRMLGPWLPCAAALAGWVLETALARPRLAAARLGPRPRQVIAAVCTAGAMAIGASMLGSLRWDYPDVSNIQSDAAAPLGVYLKEVMSSAASVFRLRHHSLFMSTSFWAGFGWLDTIPGEWFVTALVALTGASLAALLRSVSGEARKAAWLGMFLGGSVVTLALYAFSAKQIETNLHGRYLIGWYASALAVAWTWPAMARSGLVRAVPRPALMVSLALLIHAYSLCFILRRYF